VIAASIEHETTLPDPVPRPLDHLTLFGARSAPALVDRLGTLDHAGLDAATGVVADALLRRGLVGGDRVAAWLAKTRLACLLPLACARAGLVYVPVNPLLKRAQVAHILADSGARLLIAGAGRAATLEPGDLAAATLLEEESADLLAGTGGLAPSAAAPDTLAAILYTSGSTGRPKGVMLSHANLWLGAVSVAHYLKLEPSDRALCVLPLSFDYGQNQLLSTWAAGGCAVPLDYLTPRDVIRAVERHGITTLAGVPPLWVQLAEADWPVPVAAGLTRLTNSGGRLPVPLVRRLRGLFPVADLYSMYGLTEAFRSTYLDPSLIDAHPDSIGGAIPFAEILILRPDGSEADAMEAGELVHAGPLVAHGYWRDPERTAHRFRPAPRSARSGGRAVWSGDTVMRGADGLLRFVGRDDEMIKTAGNRVSPNEVEEAAIASGVVAEAVALGVPDPRLGAAIRLVARGDGGQEATLVAHLKRELPGFMQPREIVWRAELPRNANGKLDRSALRAELGEVDR
jgi:acyl-CoA ligase (AMP-forming) (exosortase A-associated)